MCSLILFFCVLFKLSTIIVQQRHYLRLGPVGFPVSSEGRRFQQKDIIFADIQYLGKCLVRTHVHQLL
jgi:hypothetical protein